MKNPAALLATLVTAYLLFSAATTDTPKIAPLKAEAQLVRAE
jgi:hypothetical protein